MSQQRYTIVRLTHEGEHFEILVKPDPALDYRLGKIKSLSDVLASDMVYSDADKGTRPSEDKLKKAFGTTDTLKVAETILRRGMLQLTTDQRRHMIEEKRKQIVFFISRNCVDPKTNLPHPPTRVEQAMEQIHYSIDPFKETEEQARDIIKLLRPIIPIKMEQVSVSVRIPPEYATRAYGSVKGFGTIRNEEWRADGSWTAIVEMPAGLYGPFLEKLGELTKGTGQAKIG
jgi:ribosome maturation protein SDO1